MPPPLPSRIVWSASGSPRRHPWASAVAGTSPEPMHSGWRCLAALERRQEHLAIASPMPSRLAVYPRSRGPARGLGQFVLRRPHGSDLDRWLAAPPDEQADDQHQHRRPSERAGRPHWVSFCMFGRRTPAMRGKPYQRDPPRPVRYLPQRCGRVALGRDLAAADRAPAEVATPSARRRPASGRRPRSRPRRARHRCARRGECRLGRQCEQGDEDHAAAHFS